MNTSSPKLPEQEVLFAFSDEENQDAATLEFYLKQYPEYREALIELSVELLVSPIDDLTEEKNIDSVEITKNAWSKFQSLLNPSDPLLAGRPVANPLAALDQKTFISVAKTLNVSRTFLSRFRDSTILSTTIPDKFVEKISTALEVGKSTLLAAFQTPPTISSSASFKSDKKPVAEAQMTFNEAVENSGLSEDQKEQLKAMGD